MHKRSKVFVGNQDIRFSHHFVSEIPTTPQYCGSQYYSASKPMFVASQDCNNNKPMSQSITTSQDCSDNKSISESLTASQDCNDSKPMSQPLTASQNCSDSKPMSRSLTAS